MDNYADPRAQQDQSSNPAPHPEERLEWETPKLIVESVDAVTEGGFLHNPHIDGFAYT